MFQLDFDSSVNQVDHGSTSDHTVWPVVLGAGQGDERGEPTKSEILLELGVLYWRRGNFDRSEQLITKALEVHEDDRNILFLAHCFIGLALVKNSLEKADEAIASYEQALTLTPGNAHLWNNLGNLYLKQKSYEQARENFKKALNMNPIDTIAWAGLADTCYQAGEVEDAIRAYERVISLMQNTEVSHNKYFLLSWSHLAALYTKKCQYEKAIAAYKKLLMQEESAETWFEIGSLYIKTESHEEATKALLNAIELHPKYGEAHLKLGIAYKELGKYQDSISHFLESIDLLENEQKKELAGELMENAIHSLRELRTIRSTKQPAALRMKAYAHNDVSWFYYRYKEENTSIDFSCSAESVEKLVKKTVRNLANVSNETQPGKGEREMFYGLPSSSAEKNYRRLKNKSAYSLDMKRESSDPHVWNEKGNTHFRNKAYADAINAYTIAIELDPDFGQPYNNLALIHSMQGNYNEAVLNYRKSINLLTTDREKAIAWNGLGNVYRRVKDYSNARVAYQNAAELDEQNGGVYDHTDVFEVSEELKTADFWNDLGKFFYQTGAYEKATSAFQEAIRLEPSSGISYSHLARTLTTQGRYREAVALYHKSIDLISNNDDKANAWNRLGDVHRKLNDYDDALTAYQNATTLKNDQFSLLHRARFSLLCNCTAK